MLEMERRKHDQSCGRKEAQSIHPFHDLLRLISLDSAAKCLTSACKFFSVFGDLFPFTVTILSFFLTRN